MATVIEIISNKCAEIDSANKTQTSTDSFDVGAFSGQVNASFAFFDVSGIPNTAVITSAVLQLRQFDGTYYSAAVTMRAAACTSYIANTAISWNNQPGVSGTFYDDLSFSGNTNAYRQWSIPTGYGSNLNGLRVSNYLIFRVSAPGASAGDNNAKGFRPSAYSTAAYRPKLTLAYELQRVKAYIGGTFVVKPLKVWKGSAWVTPPVKHWNGSAWVV